MTRAQYHATRRQLHELTMRAVAHSLTSNSPGWGFADYQRQKRDAEEIDRLRASITPRVNWERYAQDQRTASRRRDVEERVAIRRHQRAAARRFAIWQEQNPEATRFARAWMASGLGVAP